jgi:DNA-binding NtrC family response regulator
MSRATPKLLLVDDEERFLKTLGKRLEEKGFSVMTATNGPEALKVLQESTPDVVVLDIIMPGMSGIETLGEIQKQGLGVEVIMLTGHGTIDTAIEGMRLGAHDYLLKPSDLEHLVEKIHSAYKVKLARDKRLQEAQERALLDKMEKRIRL